MEYLLGALLVFALRVTDVSIGTLRVLFTVRGHRIQAAMLGFLESGIFIFAISRVLVDMNYAKMVGYACGFATGTVLGMSIERWIASGYVLVWIISRQHAERIRSLLRSAGFGATALHGEGLEGQRTILFVAAARRRGDELLQLVRQTDPEAFITVDPLSQAIGGYMPHVPTPMRA